MTGAATTERGFLQGTYSKSAKENGKLTWTKGSYALWWSTKYGLWIVGYKTNIESDKGFLTIKSGLPYSLNNAFEYLDGNNKWVKPINEIFVDCTSLEIIGK